MQKQTEKMIKKFQKMKIGLVAGVITIFIVMQGLTLFSLYQIGVSNANLTQINQMEYSMRFNRTPLGNLLFDLMGLENNFSFSSENFDFANLSESQFNFNSSEFLAWNNSFAMFNESDYDWNTINLPNYNLSTFDPDVFDWQNLNFSDLIESITFEVTLPLTINNTGFFDLKPAIVEIQLGRANNLTSLTSFRTPTFEAGKISTMNLTFSMTFPVSILEQGSSPFGNMDILDITLESNFFFLYPIKLHTMINITGAI